MELEMMERKLDLQMRYSEFLAEYADYEYDMKVNAILIESDQSGTKKSIGDKIKELIRKLTEALKNLFHKLFPEKSPEKIVDEAKKVLDDNPSLKNAEVEVEIPDFKKVSEKIKYCKSLIDKYKGKMKRGEILNDTEMAALKNAKDEVKQHKQKIKRRITLSALLAIVGAMAIARTTGRIIYTATGSTFSDYDKCCGKVSDYTSKSIHASLNDEDFDIDGKLETVVNTDFDIEREKILLLRDGSSALQKFIINLGLNVRGDKFRKSAGNQEYLDRLNKSKSNNYSDKNLNRYSFGK